MNRLFKKLILLAVAGYFSMGASGCLMTRGDVKEAEQKKNVQDQVVTLQKTNADQNSRFSEVNADLRELSGRVDVVENKVNIIARQSMERTGGEATRAQEMEKKLVLMQEEMAKVEGQIVILNQELQNLKSGRESKVEGDGGKDKNLLEVADEHFAKKEWKKAILAYQRFRDQNPKSKKFAKATLRIGSSFQELGMNDEAKTFFEEVVSKFPDSSEAKTAKAKLKKK